MEMTNFNLDFPFLIGSCCPKICEKFHAKSGETFENVKMPLYEIFADGSVCVTRQDERDDLWSYDSAGYCYPIIHSKASKGFINCWNKYAKINSYVEINSYLSLSKDRLNLNDINAFYEKSFDYDQMINFLIEKNGLSISIIDTLYDNVYSNEMFVKCEDIPSFHNENFCKNCRQDLIWIRTAIICPECRTFYGGF